jgi:hypothetical protein
MTGFICLRSVVSRIYCSALKLPQFSSYCRVSMKAGKYTDRTDPGSEFPNYQEVPDYLTLTKTHDVISYLNTKRRFRIRLQSMSTSMALEQRWTCVSGTKFTPKGASRH